MRRIGSGRRCRSRVDSAVAELAPRCSFSLSMSFRSRCLPWLVATQVAGGIEIRTYDADDHDRFLDFPSSPTINPNQDFAHLDLTGIGWYGPSPDIQLTLVSRQHVLFASHFAGVINHAQPIQFLNAAGEVVARVAPTDVFVQNGGQNTDLALFTLASPIDEGEGIQPMAVLDASSLLMAPGQTLAVCGKNPPSTTGKYQVIAQATLVDFLEEELGLDTNADEIADFESSAYQFDYLFASGDPDESYFVAGDSGSPTFIDVAGTAALVGVHSARNPIEDEEEEQIGWENFDTYVPDYRDEIDLLMAPMGYRLRPVNPLPTTLAGVASVTDLNPRRAMPLEMEFELENSGANLTGNVEVEFHFPPGNGPDSIVGSGWVTYGSGEKWTLRRALLDEGETGTMSASWSSAPTVPELAFTVTWRSDGVGDQSVNPVFPLDPSFAEWADGLSEPGQNDDPDDDGLVNLLEYALGGDPTSGSMKFADGELVQPVLSIEAGQVSLRHPQRVDKEVRGLSYSLEFSPDLNGWSGVAPAGISSTTLSGIPDLEGFETVVHTWPVSPGHRFVRLQVTLTE